MINVDWEKELQCLKEYSKVWAKPGDKVYYVYCDSGFHVPYQGECIGYKRHVGKLKCHVVQKPGPHEEFYLNPNSVFNTYAEAEAMAIKMRRERGY